jgi:hypothetical protein
VPNGIIQMRRPKFYVDFNELIEGNLVALSADDTKATATGDLVRLHEGLEIDVYSDDVDDHGKPDSLVASGLVERNQNTIVFTQVKWCCRIDDNGIRHESDIA